MAKQHTQPFVVLFEDEFLVAFEKPSGMLVAPDRWDKSKENLATLVHEHVSPEYFNAHRLDRGTSGIVLFAKNKETLRAIVAGFESRSVRKTYTAITLGSPIDSEGVIEARIAPDPVRPGAMKVSRSGKPCETEYRLLERYRNGCALLELHPLTGRTHQIRVHLARILCPIAADPLYGPGDPLKLSQIKRSYRGDPLTERPLLARLALHSGFVQFVHPATGSEVRIESPLPSDMQIALKYLRKFSATK